MRRGPWPRRSWLTLASIPTSRWASVRSRCRQRDAILDELELLRRADPSLEHFFVTATAEPFFVKNLENIQGDERDVIFISVGYGKDASGYMAMNFGPLSNDGGERRLNVLITRARECCSVFSSIAADDIDLNRARSRGAAGPQDLPEVRGNRPARHGRRTGTRPRLGVRAAGRPSLAAHGHRSASPGRRRRVLHRPGRR